MSGYFKRRDCKGRKSGSACKGYIAISPKGQTNYGDIDTTGYCAKCRAEQGIAKGQQSLGI